MAAMGASKFGYPEDFDEKASGFLSEEEDEFDEGMEAPRFPDTLLVWNLPIVKKGGEDDKYGKLCKVIKKKLSKDGSEDDPGFELEMKVNEVTNESYGFAWLKYPSKQAVEKARTRVHGLKFGRECTLRAIPFDEYENIRDLQETFVLPKNKQIKHEFLSDCRDWRLECKEQLLLRFQQETQIYWLDPLQSLMPYYGGERQKANNKVWCDWKVFWSTHGNFIVTCHKLGVCLWGGENMAMKRRLMHAEVCEMMFSPTEEYLITWNGASKESGDAQAYKIWNVQTGRTLKSVPTPAYSPNGCAGFPHMVFSPDSKYFARCTEKEINIHTMPSCALYKRPQDDEPMPIRFENGVAHFEFSPKDNIIAVWSPQLCDTPSSLTVLNVETHERMQTRSRTNFNACTSWQSEGDFLCVILSKRGKTKEGKESKTVATKKLEILRIREKNIPVDGVDVEENIKGFFWEPKASRFALLTESPIASKTVLQFYSLASAKCEMVSQFELNSAGYNKVIWAPEGQYFVIAAMGSGDLVWGRMHPDTNQMELLSKDEHFNVNFIEWDPSGRYLMTAVCCPMADIGGQASVAQDAGITIWTFQGRPLHRDQIEKLYNVGWRPHPPRHLSSDQEKDIRKNLKIHSKRFEQLDDMARDRQRREIRERRDSKIKEFKETLAVLDKNFLEHSRTNGWKDAWDLYREQHRWKDVEETFEELLETKEEAIEF